MALPIETLSNIIVLKDKDIFSFKDPFVQNEVRKLMEEGKRFMATISVGKNQVESFVITPVLISNKGPEPLWFKQDMVYLEGNPLPHCITHRIIRDYVIYEIDIL